MMKFLILAAVILVVVQLVRVTHAGMRLHLHPQSMIFDSLLRKKKWAVADYVVSLIVAITLVEVLVRTSTDADVYPRLVEFHLTFVCIFTTSLFLMLWPFNGSRNPQWHKRLRKIHFSSLCVLALSGLPMLYLISAPSMGDLYRTAFRL